MSEYNAKCTCGKCHNEQIYTDNNETEPDKSSDASLFKTYKFPATIFFIEIVMNFCVGVDFVFRGRGQKYLKFFK